MTLNNGSSSSVASSTGGANTTASNRSSSASFPMNLSFLVWASLVMYGAYVALSSAYKIRLFAIEEFGPVIHEFDPYFNYRATEVSYLGVFLRRCSTVEKIRDRCSSFLTCFNTIHCSIYCTMDGTSSLRGSII